MASADVSTLMLGVWGVVTVGLYGAALHDRLIAYRVHHDDRARRQLISGIALMVVAASTATVIASAIVFGRSPNDIRAVLLYVALAAFAAAGYYLRDESHPDH